MAEITIKVLQSWKPESLTSISDKLNLDRKGLVDLQDELTDGADYDGWVGADHYSAQKAHTLLEDDLVDYVAEIAKVIGALDTAATEITSAQTSLENAISTAESNGYKVNRATGTVTSTEPAEDTADAIHQQKVAGNYADLITSALESAATADSDLAAALKSANSGDIDVDGTLADQDALVALRNKTPEEQAAYLLDHPEYGKSVLETLPPGVRQEIGDQLAERSEMITDGDEVFTPERLEALNEAFDAYGQDPVVATAFAEKLGPKGLLELNREVASLAQDDDHRDTDPDAVRITPEMARQLGNLQTNLGETLSSATAGLTGDDQEGTRSRVSSEWVQQLREEGEKKYTLDGEYRDTRGNQVYGYQLLGPLLHSVDSHYLLTEVGDGMLEFETTFAHENGGHLPWNIRMVDGEPASVTRLTSSFATEGLRLDWTQGYDDKDAAGFDPMGALMDGLSNNPQASRDFLNGELPSELAPKDTLDGKPYSRVDYLMTDRHWMTDLTDHYMNNTDDIADGERLPKEPNGLERFADALQVATMDDTVDPEERKQIGNILDNVVDSATDKPVDPDDFKHLDLVNPSLRDDLGEIFAYHSETTHETFVGGDNADVGPYGTNFDEGRFRNLLADLGKDEHANDVLRTAAYTEAVHQMKIDLEGTPDPATATKVHSEAMGQILGSMDYGAQMGEIGNTQDSDKAHNDDVAQKAGLAKDVVGLIPTGKNPITGIIFDKGTEALIDNWEKSNQVDHTGSAEFDAQAQYNGRKLMAESLFEQILLDMGYSENEAHAAAADAAIGYTSGYDSARGPK